MPEYKNTIRFVSDNKIVNRYLYLECRYLIFIVTWFRIQNFVKLCEYVGMIKAVIDAEHDDCGFSRGKKIANFFPMEHN